MKLIFKIGRAEKDGRSKIELVLEKDKKKNKSTAPTTDQILPTLDKLLKRNKIKVESLKRMDIKLEINKEAGLTSQRITKAIVKALSL